MKVSRPTRRMPKLEHVLWIGGPSGAGKTAVALRIAKRHGLRLYNSDVMTWSHRDRALAEGDAAALRWEELRTTNTLDHLVPEELEKLSLRSQRADMVLHDLAGMPPSPLIIAEGGVLPVWVIEQGVAEPSQVLWLLPTVQVQAQNLARRGWRGLAAGTSTAFLEQSRLLAERKASEHRIPTLVVDGSWDLMELTSRVEVCFAEALARGPVAKQESERRSLMRELNLAKVDNLRRASARTWFRIDPDAMEERFVCECEDRECIREVACAVDRAAAAPVIAPGHQS